MARAAEPHRRPIRHTYSVRLFWPAYALLTAAPMTAGGLLLAFNERWSWDAIVFGGAWLVLSGATTIVMLWVVCQRRPLVVLDASGFQDRRTMKRPVPWTEIESVGWAPFTPNSMFYGVRLGVREPERFARWRNPVQWLLPCLRRRGEGYDFEVLFFSTDPILALGTVDSILAFRRVARRFAATNLSIDDPDAPTIARRMRLSEDAAAERLAELEQSPYEKRPVQQEPQAKRSLRKRVRNAVPIAFFLFCFLFCAAYAVHLFALVDYDCARQSLASVWQMPLRGLETWLDSSARTGNPDRAVAAPGCSDAETPWQTGFATALIVSSLGMVSLWPGLWLFRYRNVIQD